MRAKPDRSFEIPPQPDLSHEQALASQGFKMIAGLDEAGRGAWAGPVMAAAVILPVDDELMSVLSGVRDSKQMTAGKRVYWEGVIKEAALCVATGSASHQEIDQLGILPATRLAMQRAVAALAEYPDHLLVDALRLPALEIPQTTLIKGDQRSLSIAAASVLAKTSRDRILCACETEFPEYGFSAHKGYGTKKHRTAINSRGACAIHRRSYRPLRELEQEPPQIET